MSAVKNKWKVRTPKRAWSGHRNFSQAVGTQPRIHSHIDPPIRSAPPTWKRALDIIYILISLPITLPVMVALALWIKCVSQGPILYRQMRIGYHKKWFTLYKFRTMKMDADVRNHLSYFRSLAFSNQPMVKLDLLSDPRLLPGACLVRAAGLDELPQLFNILRGEMSLVGPRPCLVEELPFFNSKQRERFSVLPGLTGIWQVHGMGNATFCEMNAMDVFYAQRMSPTLDLQLIFRTPLTQFRQIRQAMQHYRFISNKARPASLGGAMSNEYSTQRLSEPLWNHRTRSGSHAVSDLVNRMRSIHL